METGRLENVNQTNSDLFSIIQNHSQAYAEIMNLIVIGNVYKGMYDKFKLRSEPSVQLSLLKQTINRLVKKTYETERQDIILKIQSIDWN